MEIEKICLHPSFANSYLLKKDNKAILIDPGYNFKHDLEKITKDEKLDLIGILLTHGHIDHFYGLANWENLEKIPIFMGKGDIPYLKDPNKNASFLFGEKISLDNVKPYPLEDEDEIKLGDFLIKVIETPYHTEGGVCFFIEDYLFSGDSLFKGSIGRYDLPGSKPELMKESLKKLFSLKNEVKVYPGHGEITSIGQEKANNPYLNLLN